MLVLRRSRDQTIMVGDDIEITIVDIFKNDVRVGISAPKELAVHRREVYDAIREQDLAAEGV